MKAIALSKEFQKRYKERISGNKSLEKRVDDRIKLFKIDPTPVILRDHALIGKFKDSRSFSITGAIRIVYQIRIVNGKPISIFNDIGTHNQVYE